MPNLIFLSGKDKSIKVYKAACVLSKTEFNLNDFLKKYPEQEIDAGGFIKNWKLKESSVLSGIEQIYNHWKNGEILVGLFPKRTIFRKFPKNYQRCSTFGLNNRAYIILFPTIKEKRFSFKVLIHELFHANDALRKRFGKADAKKHKWFEIKAQEIFKKYFKC